LWLQKGIGFAMRKNPLEGLGFDADSVGVCEQRAQSVNLPLNRMSLNINTRSHVRRALLAFAGGALLFVLAVILASHCLYVGHRWGDDFAAYILQAKMVAGGMPRRLIEMMQFRAMQSSHEIVIGPTFYPWGFPVFLAGVYFIFGDNITAMKLLEVAFYALSVVMTFSLFRRYLGPWPAILIALTFAVIPTVVEQTNWVQADFPALFLTLASLGLIDRFIVQKEYFLDHRVSLCLLGLVIFGAIFVRTAAVVLLPVLLATQIMEAWPREVRRPIVGLVTAARASLPWQILPYAVFILGFVVADRLFAGTDTSYVSSGHFAAYGSPATLLAVVSDNIVYFRNLFAEFLALPQPPHIDVAITMLIMGPLAVYGSIVVVRRQYPFVLFVVLHMTMLLVYPNQFQQRRMVFPVLPFYFYFIFTGAARLSRLSWRWHRRAVSIPLDLLIFLPLCTHLLLVTLSQARAIAADPSPVEGPYTAASAQMFDFIKHCTVPDDVLVFWKPRAMILFGERRSILRLAAPDVLDGTASLVAFPVRNPDDYSREDLRKVIAAAPERFELVFSNEDYRVYRVLTDGTSPVIPATCRT
jgi:4-amino-4-deoxy-L-arabinose transferase-like glycosyltransferase